MEEKPECYGKFPVKKGPTQKVLKERGCIIDPLYDLKHGIEREIIKKHYMPEDPTDEKNDWLIYKYWSYEDDSCHLLSYSKYKALETKQYDKRVTDILKTLSGGYKPEYKQKILYSILKHTSVTEKGLQRHLGIPYKEFIKCIKILKLEANNIFFNYDDDMVEDGRIIIYHIKNNLSEEFKKQLIEGLEKLIKN